MTGKAAALTACMAAALLISGCAYTQGVTGTPAGSNPEQQLPTYWRPIATEHDRWRIANWRRSFTEGVADASAGGHAAAVAAEGNLLRPDAGLADPLPPAGDYRCRFIKLGSQASLSLSYVAYPWFRCRIEPLEGPDSDAMRFMKLDGSQRPIGTLYPDSRLRMIFLGVLQLGDETRPHVYGRDDGRDMAGVFERIGEGRWRIVFPYPRFESLVDVMELVPES